MNAKTLFDWLFNRPVEQLGNAMYLTVFLWIAVCTLFAHWRGKVNLWDLVTSTDRNGTVRTDSAKFFMTGAFVITSVTFCYLAVTKQLSEWYVAIFLAAFLGERFRRDLMQLKQIVALGPTEQQKKAEPEK